LEDRYGYVIANPLKKLLIRLWCTFVGLGLIIVILKMMGSKFILKVLFVGLAIGLLISIYFYIQYVKSRNQAFSKYIKVIKYNLPIIQKVLEDDVYYDSRERIDKDELAIINRRYASRRDKYLKNNILHGKYKNNKYKLYPIKKVFYPVKNDDVKVEHGYIVILEGLCEDINIIRNNLEKLNKTIYADMINDSKLRIMILNDLLFEYEITVLKDEVISEYIYEDALILKEILDIAAR